MSKYRDDIRQEDCPPGRAPHYPGKKTKNNKNGSDLSYTDFVDKVISDWVSHFLGNKKYEEAPFSHKIKYLVPYLKPLNVNRNEAGQRLITAETRLAADAQLRDLADRQSTFCTDMDIDEVVDEEVDVDKESSKHSRWDRAKKVDNFLELSDQRLFNVDIKIPDDVKASKRFKQREKRYFLAMSDKDLFENKQPISNYTKKSPEYQDRHQKYINNYMEENFGVCSSQEILEKLSQTPYPVQNSEIYKDLLSHLCNAEKSEKLVMKNIKDSLNELEKTAEGRKDAKKIIAAVSHPVFGDPGLGLNQRQCMEAKTMKANLLTGKTTTLELPHREARKIYPDMVKTIATDHWKEITILEPAKHTGKAVCDDGETVPTRYQDKTDSECYENFKEECREKVRIEMSRVSQELKEKLTKRQDSMDKRRRLEYADSLPDKFPSLDWYIAQRPPETKPLCDHTTGLCHVCESAKLNFSKIVKTAKSQCSCRSKSCPGFSCACPITDEEEDNYICTCPPCECEACSMCKVSKIYQKL